MPKFPHYKAAFLLPLCTIFIFAGRAYQYWFFDAPIRSLLWDEAWMSKWIERFFGLSWQAYVTDPDISSAIQRGIVVAGWLLFLGALSAGLLWWRHRPQDDLPQLLPQVGNSTLSRFSKATILFSTLILLIHALLETKEHFYHLGQLFEYGIQLGTPALYLLSLSNRSGSEKWLLPVAKVLIAVTFIAHGLYALGFYPVPGHFVDMTISCLGLNEPNALRFLTLAGIGDFVVAILIFIPKVNKWALAYAFIWGCLTALARIYYGFDLYFIADSIHQWAYQTIYRLPHGLLPLFVFLQERKQTPT